MSERRTIETIARNWFADRGYEVQSDDDIAQVVAWETAARERDAMRAVVEAARLLPNVCYRFGLVACKQQSTACAACAVRFAIAAIDTARITETR